jgi:hypothetical protein
MIISALSLFILIIPGFFILKPSPKSIGEPESLSNPENIYDEGEKEMSFIKILIPIFKSLKFYYLCCLAAGFLFQRGFYFF